MSKQKYIPDIAGGAIILSSLHIYKLPGFFISTAIVGTIIYLINKRVEDE